MGFVFPNIDPVLFHNPFIPALSVRYYALAYIIGFLFGQWYIERLVKTQRLWKHQPPMTPQQAVDLSFFIILGVILGGRLGYVLFYKPWDFLARPLDIVKVYQGGMAYHGGVIGVILATLWFVKRLPDEKSRNQFKRFVAITDLITAIAPLGLMLGRIANFINSELWGRQTTFSYGFWVQVNGEWQLRHASQLYEAFLEGFVLLVVLQWLIWRRQGLYRSGWITACFLTGYGVFRIIAEHFREPDANLGFLLGDYVNYPLTMGMILSVPMVLVGIGLGWYSRKVD